MIRIGVVGYGYWGPNLVRNFFECPDTEVAAVADMRQERLDLVARRYPGLRLTTTYKDLLNDPAIDAVAISTPVTTHFPLAMEALRAGKHVLVEKPMAASIEEAERLIDEAERRKLVLMVDHTFVYTGAVRKIRELIDKGSLGSLYYLRLDAREPGSVPARCGCGLGFGRSRSFNYGFPASPNACGRFGDRAQPCPGSG